jgi:hypothetical protein
MTTRCFTFGFAHAHPSGFVRITAADASACRDEMIRRYSNKWAFEYSEEQIADQMKRFPQMYEVKEEMEAAQ